MPNGGSMGIPTSNYSSLIIHIETTRHFIGRHQHWYVASQSLSHKPHYLAFGDLLAFCCQ